MRSECDHYSTYNKDLVVDLSIVEEDLKDNFVDAFIIKAEYVDTNQASHQVTLEVFNNQDSEPKMTHTKSYYVKPT
jgi:hypothetical protein